MSEPSSSPWSAYYRAEAERVAQLAEAAAPGRGQEAFAKVASEYRTLADYYETMPSLDSVIEPTDFPIH